MPLFGNSPFEDLVVQATSEKNVQDDWAIILDICDKAVNYEEGPKLIIQAITKRLYNSVPRVVLQALLLLDACVKNCGKRFLLEVSSRNFIGELQKLLQKIQPSASDKLKSLIKKWAEQDFKDDPELGLVPSLYYKLKSEGIQFPEEESEKPKPAVCTNPDAVSSQEEEEDIMKAITLSLKDAPQAAASSNNISSAGGFNEPVKVELLKVRAVYDFEAVEDNELTIQAGEIIVVIDKSNESWWKGTNQRGEGYFPVSFVTEDLEAPIDLLFKGQVEEQPAEVIEEEIVEKPPIVIDEQKIEMALHLLNERDPTDESPDDENLLELESECYAMTPLIEGKLQEIDKRFTVLNSLNEDIMKAIQTFYKLTRDSMTPSQHMYYYNVPVNPMVTNQQTQDVTSVQQQNAGLGRLTARSSIAPDPGNLYVAPCYLPNLTNLSSSQIRENVESLSFAHSSQLHQPYYGTLPSKLPNVQPTFNSRLSLPNIVPYASIPLNQPTVGTSVSSVEENSESRMGGATSHDMQFAHQNVTNNQNYAGTHHHVPASTPPRNISYGGGTSDIMSSPSELRTPTELSPVKQSFQNYVVMPGTISHGTATIGATNQVISDSSNSSAIPPNGFPTASVLPNTVVTPQERH